MVVLDGGIPAHRLALLPEYKAQRPRMPDDLRRQMPVATDYLARAAIAELRVEGEEADDLIASVAARAQPEAEVLIATSDKDALQLVNERVQVVSPVQTGRRLGPAEVYAKCGAHPAQVVDWLALTGDSVDNIPGIPGLGPKTAAKLLAQFGSLAGILARVDEVTPERIREALRLNREQLGRNVALIRLKTDLECPLDWERLAVRPETPERLLPFYEQWELHSLAKELRAPTLL
jgi:DNA polymerase-1